MNKFLPENHAGIQAGIHRLAHELILSKFSKSKRLLKYPRLMDKVVYFD